MHPSAASHLGTGLAHGLSGISASEARAGLSIPGLLALCSLKGLKRGRPAGSRIRGDPAMETRTDEIAERVYRFSTAATVGGGQAFTFNQFLIDAEAPMLFHLGHRGFFPLISAAVAR